jgi:hypothetical protein
LHSKENQPTVRNEQTLNINRSDHPMSLTASLPQAVLETILLRLSALFLIGAAGDAVAARQAAAHMLDSHHPETAEEVSVAANVIIFNFQALEALSQAATPNMPITRVMSLRSGAVSLSRQSQKTEQRLEHLQNARLKGKPVQPAAPAQPEPKLEKIEALIEDTGNVAAAAKANGQTWTQAYEIHQREARIAASQKRAEAKFGPFASAATPGASPQSKPPPEGSPDPDGHRTIRTGVNEIIPSPSWPGGAKSGLSLAAAAPSRFIPSPDHEGAASFAYLLRRSGFN